MQPKPADSVVKSQPSNCCITRRAVPSAFWFFYIMFLVLLIFILIKTLCICGSWCDCFQGNFGCTRISVWTFTAKPSSASAPSLFRTGSFRMSTSVSSLSLALTLIWSHAWWGIQRCHLLWLQCWPRCCVLCVYVLQELIWSKQDCLTILPKNIKEIVTSPCVLWCSSSAGANLEFAGNYLRLPRRCLPQKLLDTPAILAPTGGVEFLHL